MFKKLAAAASALAMAASASAAFAQEQQQVDEPAWEVVECFTSRDGSWGGCIYRLRDGTIVVVQGHIMRA